MSATLQRKSNIVPTSREDIGDDPLEIRAVIAAIDEFSELEDDYDAMDGLAPKHLSIESAQFVIRQAHLRCIRLHAKWESPDISLDPDGDIHMEWHKPESYMTLITHISSTKNDFTNFLYSVVVAGSKPIRINPDSIRAIELIESYLSLS